MAGIAILLGYDLFVGKDRFDMLFNSYEFIFAYLPVVWLVYFFVRKRSIGGSIWWLFLASLFFYGWWDYHYVPLLLGSIAFNYLVSRRIDRRRHAKEWLTFGVLGDLALLGYFKYTDFFLDTLNALGGSFELQHIILPLGISFFTFTQIAYLVDVYRQEARVTDAGGYGLFVTIFPHLIAGPIINYKDVMPQLLKRREADEREVSLGLFYFTMGLFKKVVIADQLALIANPIFAASTMDASTAWLGALSYTLQLYFDFSGYSEMAVGLGLLFHVKLPINFNSPYQAGSIIDFWRRWHMSLGSWVKNYIYIPLGGNRKGQGRKLLNLLLAMTLIGFWHGAGWTFILWGVWHGICLVINHAFRQRGGQLPLIFGRALTFLAVVAGWVIFRAKDLTAGKAMLCSMADFGNLVLPASDDALLILGLLLVTWFVPNTWEIGKRFQPKIGWLVLLSLLWCVIFYSFSHLSDFLYFQF